MYKQRSVGNESLFYIYEQKLPSIDINGLKTNAVKYNYTYLQKTDSVTMILSVKLPEISKKIEVDLKGNNIDTIFSPEIIYVQPTGKKYEYRLKISFPFETFEKIYAQDTPFRLIVNINDNVGSLSYIFGYSQKQWIKNREKMYSIINIINVNVGR